MKQEEPKQIKCYCGHTITCDCGPLEEPKQDSFTESINKSISIISLANSMFSPEPKQETIEEAANVFSNGFQLHLKTDNVRSLREGFVAGAKWQAERMYSEEEIKEAYWNRTDEIDVDGYWISDPEKDLEGLLKEIKKIPMTFVPDEKMYSKEDLRAAWMAAKNSSDFNEWFKQFKNKK